MRKSILVDGYSTVNKAKPALSRCLQEGSATVMAVTAAQARQALAIRGYQAGELAGNRQVKNKSIAAPVRMNVPCVHSTGITISFARTMFRRLRAADSIVRGSVRSRSISNRNDWFALRKLSTSVCIRTYCCDAMDILVLVRKVTATHTESVARRIIPKMTHAGTTPPRRRTSAGVPMMSSENSLTEANGKPTRGTTRCARIRSSTQ
jgi:hypothetical protein